LGDDILIEYTYIGENGLLLYCNRFKNRIEYLKKFKLALVSRTAYIYFKILSSILTSYSAATNTFPPDPLK